MSVSSRIPVALLACGSFNPPTYAHLRMFERAKDYLEKTLHYTVKEGVISPVNDAYEKQELVSAQYRVKMLQLAVESSDWIRVDTWESSQRNWCRSLVVLRHVREQLRQKWYSKQSVQANNNNNGTEPVSNKKRRSDTTPEENACKFPKLMLLCGADLLESFAVKDLWLKEDMEEIVRDYGLVVICRNNSDPYRRALQRNESVRYLLPDNVLQYINDNELYVATTLPRDQPPSVNSIENNNDARHTVVVEPTPTKSLSNFPNNLQQLLDEFSDYDNVQQDEEYARRRNQFYRIPSQTFSTDKMTSDYRYHRDYPDNPFSYVTNSSTANSATYLDKTTAPSSVTLASGPPTTNGYGRLNGNNNDIADGRKLSHEDDLYRTVRKPASILRKPRPFSYHQDLNKRAGVSTANNNAGIGVSATAGSMTNLSSGRSTEIENEHPDVDRPGEIAWEYDPEKTKSLPNLKVKWWSPKNVCNNILQNHKLTLPPPTTSTASSVANIVLKVKQLRLTITPETTV